MATGAAVPETAAAAVVRVASDGYAGANHSHFTELLRDREGIDLSRPTVRRVLVKAGIGSPRTRRSQQHRFRRRRMPQEGMLVQIDGSQHPWVEDRGPKLTLLIAVDDATGTEGSEALFTLIAERYERRPPRITSNLVFSEWELIFSNPMATAPAIDRVVHHSVILEFDVPSYRTNAAQQRGQDKQVNRQI